MEARLLADEHFGVRIVAELRAKGHDVVTVRQLNENKSGDGWSDEAVLESEPIESRSAHGEPQALSQVT
jgi:hypothetical protein